MDSSDATTDLDVFVKEYESATNSHIVELVAPLIAKDATYWFTDGSYVGRDAICGALGRTFGLIQDETYEIQDVEWVAATDGAACFRYSFHWTGVVNGETRSGSGRGTNVVVKRDGSWKMLHEHLSA